MIFNAVRRNIYFKVSIIVFLGLVIPFVVVGYLEFNEIEFEMMSQARVNTTNSANLMSLGLSRALWDYSLDNVEIIVNSIMSDPSVKKVSVYDSNSKLFFEGKIKTNIF